MVLDEGKGARAVDALVLLEGEGRSHLRKALR
jgi:hypothetical protein